LYLQLVVPKTDISPRNSKLPTIEQARQWYQDSDAVHNFDHVLRVYRLAERLAREEGADVEIVRAAALLHDAVGSAPGENQERADHHEISSQFAAQVLGEEGWPEERIKAVQHCIQAHRFRSTEAPQTIEAMVLFDADKLDAIGAVGAARAIAYAALDDKPFYAEPSQQFMDSFKLADGELHSSYHEYIFKLRRIPGRLYTESGRKLAEGREKFLEQFYSQLGAEYRGEK
jgi:uncharacterized protein